MKFGQRLAAHARAHTNVSVHKDPEKYLEAVAPLIDRTSARGRRYFLAGPSTCALYGCRCAGDCEEGLDDPEFHDSEITMSYVDEIGTAVANIQKVYERRNALERYVPYGATSAQTGGLPTYPGEWFAEGDIAIIDGPPYGPHVIVVVEDAIPTADGFAGATSQGGQADGGVAAFGTADGVIEQTDTHWHLKKDAHGQVRLFAGDGQRYVIAVCRARRMDLDLDDRKSGDKTGDANPGESGPATNVGTGEQ